MKQRIGNAAGMTRLSGGRPMSDVKMTTKKKIKETITDCYAALERLQDRYAGFGSCYLSKAHDAALRGEKEHTAFGTRMLGHRPRQAFSADVRARYFACKWALDSDHEMPQSWEDAAGTRDDALFAYAFRDMLNRLSQKNDDLRAQWSKVKADFEASIAAIDYAKDLSGNSD